jgi:hypothetical protein
LRCPRSRLLPWTLRTIPLSRPVRSGAAVTSRRSASGAVYGSATSRPGSASRPGGSVPSRQPGAHPGPRSPATSRSSTSDPTRALARGEAGHVALPCPAEAATTCQAARNRACVCP